MPLVPLLAYRKPLTAKHVHVTVGEVAANIPQDSQAGREAAGSLSKTTQGGLCLIAHGTPLLAAGQAPPRAGTASRLVGIRDQSTGQPQHS